MQIIIELTDEEAAAIEAEIDTFPVYEEAVRMTTADYLKDYCQPNITRLVEAARVNTRGTKFADVVTTLKELPPDKQDAVLKAIEEELKKHDDEAPLPETGEIELPIDALEPREQKGK